jgi:lipopolysaccharide biosynthesis glycosyltransferase
VADPVIPWRRPETGAIVVCSDAGWAWQSMFAINSFAPSAAEAHLSCYIYLIGEIDPRVLAAAAPGVTIVHHTEYPKTLDVDFTTGGHVPKGSMIRFLALNELSARYDRVAYLDGDAFLNFGSIAAVMDIPDTGRPVCAVRNRSHWSTDPSHHYNINYIKRLHPDIGARYLNSGVLVVNCAAYLEAEITQRALHFYATEPQRCKFGDQSALNHVLVNNWDELSPGWNWQVSQSSMPLIAGRMPRIVHFTGPIKPWTDSYRLFDQRYFEPMEAFLRCAGLSALIPEESPANYKLNQERKRTKKLTSWMGEAFTKRELFKEFLDRKDFFDVEAGVSGYGVD